MAETLLYAHIVFQSILLGAKGWGRYVQILACPVAIGMPCGDRGVLVMNHMQEITSGMGSLCQRSFFVACMYCTLSCSLTHGSLAGSLIKMFFVFPGRQLCIAFLVFVFLRIGLVFTLSVRSCVCV